MKKGRGRRWRTGRVDIEGERGEKEGAFSTESRSISRSR